MKNRKPFYGGIGSVSTCTMRAEDLIPTFIAEALSLRLTRKERNQVNQIKRNSTESVSYDIQGDYGQGFETVTSEDSWRSAREQKRTYDENEPNIRHRVRRTVEDITSESEYWGDEASYDLEELFDILSNHSLPYFYFGAHPGDGADYGYWLGEEALDEFDGLKVNDLAEVPKRFSGEVLHVNERGNCTLYAYSRGRGREVWAIV